MKLFKFRRHSVCILAVLGVFALSTPKASALDKDASHFVSDFGGQVVAVVNSDQSMAAKKKAILPLVQKNVDIEAIGKFCLGRYWRIATPAERARYLELFNQVLVNAVSEKIGQYRGVSLEVTGSLPSSNGNGTVVSAKIMRPHQPVANMQVLVVDHDGFKVVDLMGEGTSMRLTQRQDYSSYLARNGGKIETLIAALERQISRHR
ncbi:ABC transporter substrate-binding protein [Candidatus Kirkpatrickella diaphorinae]|uniref:ABC transporter substrate-binding protein n=1 Tax=Candidatus Kirkpatrickella diaphorinae TaxID=2984322 RepID=A0ABY6GKN9_9PROT|nr:ABC transporter substrate-binding protein [Candidatus Kirkpatrickella diaphorinae]UYH51385.1 ABC transporter substrate-binding protein [Candidatus Kirkpatrickella diaphorinae]